MEFVRPATTDDLASLCDMYRLCLAEEKGTRGAHMFSVRESLSEPFEPHFNFALEDDDSYVAIGGIDDVVLGFVLAHLETLRDGAKHVVIEAIFVEAEARAVGVGEMFMEEVMSWARPKGAKTFDAYALPGDRDTKNFFEMSGFSARLLVMHHQLED
jgi:L-amino acid N-acyltransferase YncA